MLSPRIALRKKPREPLLKSKFEKTTAQAFKDAGVDVRYEPFDVFFIKELMYRPDWILPNGIVVETKGYFDSADRAKHLIIKEQFPWLDIRFVFMVDNTINRHSETRYSDWCNKHGFKFAIGEVPQQWVKEKNKPMQYLRDVGLLPVTPVAARSKTSLKKKKSKKALR